MHSGFFFPICFIIHKSFLKLSKVDDKTYLYLYLRHSQDDMLLSKWQDSSKTHDSRHRTQSFESNTDCMKGEVTRECILEITWWSSNSSPPKKTLFTKYKHAKLLKSKAHYWHIWCYKKNAQKWIFYGIPVKTLFCNFYLHELHNTQLVFFMWNIKILIWLLLTHIHVFQACINNPSVLSRYRSARCWHAWNA